MCYLRYAHRVAPAVNDIMSGLEWLTMHRVNDIMSGLEWLTMHRAADLQDLETRLKQFFDVQMQGRDARKVRIIVE